MRKKYFFFSKIVDENKIIDFEIIVALIQFSPQHLPIFFTKTQYVLVFFVLLSHKIIITF